MRTRFRRFRFPVPVGFFGIPPLNGSRGTGFRFSGSFGEEVLCASVEFHREDGSGSGVCSWKTVEDVPVPRSVHANTFPTVPVSGSGWVPGPPVSFEILSQFEPRPDGRIGHTRPHSVCVTVIFRDYPRRFPR